MLLTSSTSAHVCIFLVFSVLCLNSVQCGEEDVITDQEKEMVTQFRPLVSNFLYKDYMKDDRWLVRFLRVKNYNMEQSRNLLKELIAWRKKEKMDTILTEDLSAVEKSLPFVFEGVDNYDRPLLFANVGVVDIRKIVVAGQLDTFVRLFTAALECVEAVSREVQAEPGRGNVSRAYIILDLGGFNLRQHWCTQCIQFLPFVLRTLESYYPDRIYKFVAVNTPRAFLPIFELARPFLSPPLQKSIHLFDYDTENWKRALRADIPDDQLPIQYGGSRKVQPKTLSYLRKHDKHVKAAFEKATLELEEQKKQAKEKDAKEKGVKRKNGASGSGSGDREGESEGDQSKP